MACSPACTQIEQSYSGAWDQGAESIRGQFAHAARTSGLLRSLCRQRFLATLSRYDGQRYGFTSGGARLDASFKIAQPGFCKEAKAPYYDWHLRP